MSETENISQLIDAETQELRSVLDYINLAKSHVETGCMIVPQHHQRIAARLQIIKEELILLSVIVEHEAGFISGFEPDPDTDPAPDEEPTQVNLEPPEPIQDLPTILDKTNK